jgi:ATP-dependent Clp protease ATP-binding subunit ClpC
LKALTDLTCTPRTTRTAQLDVGLLMAGAKERGELENRVTRLLQESREAGDVILM